MAVKRKAAPTAGALPCPPDQVDDFLSQPSDKVRQVLSRTPGPVLVLGAGGKIGLHLCLMIRRTLDLLGRPDEVVAVSRFRTLRDSKIFTQHDVKTHVGDLEDQACLAALPDAPTVFFLAGVKFGTATAPHLLKKTNMDMPRHVAERFRHARIVAFSSGCVYPFMRPESGGATEETPPAPVGAYAASCLARENAFAAVATRQGTAVALIRLNYAVEFRYGLLVDIAQKVLRGEPVDLGMGHVNVIWQTDAISYSIQALDLAKSPAALINITGAEILSVRTLAQRFGELLGRPVRFAGEEADTAWLNNASRSHRLFGPPSTSVESMMTWIAAWLHQGGTTWGKPTGFERRDGRF
jgi:nucleoside-diphosphate-sugar epimerase